jgi:hypothetical protein
MKKCFLAIGLLAIFSLTGAVFAQDDNAYLEELISMKMNNLETLEGKISGETLLTPEYKEECFQEIQLQKLFYQNALNTIDQIDLKELLAFARVHDKKNKECIDFALQKRLEVIREKQDRLKNRWGRFGWFFN